MITGAYFKQERYDEVLAYANNFKDYEAELNELRISIRFIRWQ